MCVFKKSLKWEGKKTKASYKIILRLKHAVIWYDMIWYDMILIFAQNCGPKAELQCTIWDKKGKKHSITRYKAKSTAIDNRETRPNCKAGEQRRK